MLLVIWFSFTRSREVDLMILMGPLQPEIFYDSVFLCFSYRQLLKFFPEVSFSSEINTFQL